MPNTTNTQDTPQVIKKEEIPNLHLLHEEVLEDEKEQLQRKIDLQRATSLSNTDKTKVKIYFKAKEGMFRVHTTIWATTSENITLKGGVTIPIACIVRVI